MALSMLITSLATIRSLFMIVTSRYFCFYMRHDVKTPLHVSIFEASRITLCSFGFGV